MGTFTKAFLNMPSPQGRRVAILAAGGGQSVSLADTCAREGLEVPTLSEATLRELRSYIPVAGNSIRNPLDAAIAESTTKYLHRTLELLDADPLVDMLIVHRHVHHHGDPGELKLRRTVVEGLIEYVEASRHTKPIVMALSSGGYDPPVEEERLYLRTKLASSKVTACDSMALAALTLSLLTRYWEVRRAAL
jgi:acyl-CoA synthetase (NDP forming)